MENSKIILKHKTLQASLKLIMKRNIYRHLMIYLILVSCNQVANEEPVIIPVNEKHYPNMSFHINTSLSENVDSSIVLLGCGYDCKHSLVKGNKYTRKKVIDIKRLLEGNGYDKEKQLVIKFPTSQINKSILHQSGYASSIMSESFNKYIGDFYSESGVKTCINNKQLNLFSIISDSIKSPHVKDGYFLFEYIRPTCRLTLPTIYPEQLCYFLSENFIKDLYTKTADKIVADYGTHVLTDILLGGCISISHKVIFSQKRTYIDIVKEMNLYHDHLYNSTFSTNGQEYFEGCDSINTHLHLTGGEPFKIQINNNQILNFQDWMQTIIKENEQIIGIGNNTNKLFLLSDFIMDINKKKKIEEAIIRYCK